MPELNDLTEPTHTNSSSLSFFNLLATLPYNSSFLEIPSHPPSHWETSSTLAKKMEWKL